MATGTALPSVTAGQGRPSRPLRHRQAARSPLRPGSGLALSSVDSRAAHALRGRVMCRGTGVSWPLCPQLTRPVCTSLDEGQILAGLNCRRAPLVARHVHIGQHRNADHEFESHCCCGLRPAAGLWHVGPIPSGLASDEMPQAAGPFFALRHSKVGGPVGS